MKKYTKMKINLKINNHNILLKEPRKNVDKLIYKVLNLYSLANYDADALQFHAFENQFKNIVGILHTFIDIAKIFYQDKKVSFVSKFKYSYNNGKKQINVKINDSIILNKKLPLIFKNTKCQEDLKIKFLFEFDLLITKYFVNILDLEKIFFELKDKYQKLAITNLLYELDELLDNKSLATQMLIKDLKLINKE